MNAAAFFINVRQRAPWTPPITDPLGEAQRFIESYGHTGEGKVVLAAVHALWKRDGEFADSDICSLGHHSLALVSALVDARVKGRYPDVKWHRAAFFPWWRFLLDLHGRLDRLELKQ
jgi:hypothetical protein